MPPNSIGLSGGYMAFAPHLSMVFRPCKFRPHLSEKYDGTINPTKFLQIQSTSTLTAGGDEAVMANYFPYGPNRYSAVMTHEAAQWDADLLARAVPPVHDQLQECLHSSEQWDGPPRRPARPKKISMLLHLAVLLGSQHHPSYLQCICCGCILPECETREDAGEAHHARHP
jgi:hypothetical protein